MDSSKVLKLLEIIKEIKITKKKFKKVIIYINENEDIKNSLSEVIKDNLKELIKMWQNNEDAEFDYYFEMKKYHTYINKQFTNEILNNMWEDYIESGLSFRVKLMFLCD